MSTYNSNLENTAKSRTSKSIFRPSRFEFSELTIKIICAVCLLLYVIGTIIFDKKIMEIMIAGQTSVIDAMNSDQRLASTMTLATIFQAMGGFSVPLFAFMLVEGFLETADCKKYLGSIVLLAFITEIPYDFAKSGSTFFIAAQNPVWGLVIAFIMLLALKKVFNKEKPWTLLVCILVVVVALFWGVIMFSEFAIMTVLYTLVYYVFRDKRNTGILVSVLLCIAAGVLGMLFSQAKVATNVNGLIYIPGVLAAFPVFLYGGKRNIKEGSYKYVFYAIVPVIYLICGIVAKYI